MEHQSFILRAGVIPRSVIKSVMNVCWRIVAGAVEWRVSSRAEMIRAADETYALTIRSFTCKNPWEKFLIPTEHEMNVESVSHGRKDDRSSSWWGDRRKLGYSLSGPKFNPQWETQPGALRADLKIRLSVPCPPGRARFTCIYSERQINYPASLRNLFFKVKIVHTWLLIGTGNMFFINQAGTSDNILSVVRDADNCARF